MATKTDTNVSKPSTVEPGDAPADTMDPTERVSSVPVRPDTEAVKVGTVNAVLVNTNLPTPVDPAAGKEPRTETYKARKPDGTVVTVTHNLETGETTTK